MVLIETLWNVKIVLPQSILRHPRINRNIVECKVKKRLLSRTRTTCINRNIVECKDSFLDFPPCCC